MSGPMGMDSTRRHQLLQDCLERIEQGEPARSVLAGVEDPRLRAVLEAQIAMADALREASMPTLPPAEVAAIGGHLRRIEAAKGGPGPWNGGSGGGFGAAKGLGLWSLAAGGLLVGAWLLARLIGGFMGEAVVEQSLPPTPEVLGAAAPTLGAPTEAVDEAAAPLPDTRQREEIEDLLARLLENAAAAQDVPPAADRSVTRPPPASVTPVPTRTTRSPRPKRSSDDEAPTRTPTSIWMPAATRTLTPAHTPTRVTPSATAESSETPSPTATEAEPTATPTRPEPSPTAETRKTRLTVRVERREGEDPIEGAKVLVYREKELVAFDAKTDAEGLAHFEIQPDTPYRVRAEHDEFHARYWENSETWEEADVIDLDPGADEDIRIRLNPRVPPPAPPVSSHPSPRR